MIEFIATLAKDYNTNVIREELLIEPDIDVAAKWAIRRCESDEFVVAVRQRDFAAKEVR